ncbi:MAG TPA: UDP-N-acetylmuramate dehydrogenase [Microlunatus sp.]|nr:UDP-N-acetylmuramate dehydrogenase [Microlunatus sp.]
MTSSSVPRSLPIGSVAAGESCEVTSLSLTRAPQHRSTTAERAERLAELTTLRVGGPAGRLVRATTETELLEAVRRADDAGEPVLVLGGGSNVLIADDGFPGTVVQVASRGIEADVSSCSGATVTVAAGEDWDAFVATAVDQEWSGIEALAGIPGLVGGTPIQNVGAYGTEVAQTIARVRTFDRTARRQVTFSVADCGFGYRTSRFKTEPGRHLVLEVTFQFPLGSMSAPIRYAELARALGVAVGARAPAAEVRQAVLALRAGKGMVLDAEDHDTWSAGSFFTNPILSAVDADALPADAPRYPQPDGRVKTSAAWLIEHGGFGKGYGSGRAGLSTKHTLALTNRGGATAADLLALAREVQAGVADRFGLVLVPEPVLVECTL